VGYGRLALRPQAAERTNGRAEERVAYEAAVEVCRIVVEREHEPRFLERRFARRANGDSAVRELDCGSPAVIGET
jgi:hypothetical protein